MCMLRREHRLAGTPLISLQIRLIKQEIMWILHKIKCSLSRSILEMIRRKTMPAARLQLRWFLTISGVFRGLERTMLVMFMPCALLLLIHCNPLLVKN